MGKAGASSTVKKCDPQKVLSGRSHLQTLAELCSLPLSAYAHDCSFWIAVCEQIAATFHEYALGSSEGGPMTALHTVDKLSQLAGTSLTLSKVWFWLTSYARKHIMHMPCLQVDSLVSLRFSPEEAIFLALAGGNMRFYQETTGLCSLEVTQRFAVAVWARFSRAQHRSSARLPMQDTWHSCVSCSSSFVHRYIAYHHYRSKVRQLWHAT